MGSYGIGWCRWAKGNKRLKWVLLELLEVIIKEMDDDTDLFIVDLSNLLCSQRKWDAKHMSHYLFVFIFFIILYLLKFNIKLNRCFDYLISFCVKKKKTNTSMFMFVSFNEVKWQNEQIFVSCDFFQHKTDNVRMFCFGDDF